MKNFVLIGVAGYIAPKHLAAIKETGNHLLAALDKHDAVGVLDNYFPDCEFFTEFERFDRHCEKLKRQGTPIDFVVVCSPNYLHDAHIRFGLRIGADVICEKPVVLNPWNIDALAEIEKETGKKVFTILQLRGHPEMIRLKKLADGNFTGKKYNVRLNYISTRGNWYQNSWKGVIEKSGGVATNIGVHFFDLLIWIFGEVIHSAVYQHDPKTATGKLEFEKAVVVWKLSIDPEQLPEALQKEGRKVYRSLVIDSETIDFSEGLENLHLKNYTEILAGGGISLLENKPVIGLLHQIRNFKTGSEGA
jgi:UDP-N-acetyl-2-amino-2-deoxyglucuronate dehydrogenase